MTPEEQRGVEARVQHAFIAGQYAMRDRVAEMIGRLSLWTKDAGSIPPHMLRPVPKLDPDARERLIARLTSGEF